MDWKKDFFRIVWIKSFHYISVSSIMVTFSASQDKSTSLPAKEGGVRKRMTGRKVNPGVFSFTTAVLPSLRLTMVPMGYADTH